MKHSIVAAFALFAVVIASAHCSSGKGSECTKLAACCGSDATCQKLADQNNENDCSTGQPLYCAGTDGGGKDASGGNDAGMGDDGEAGSNCTVQKLNDCSSGCCSGQLVCGNIPTFGTKVCCVDLNGGCAMAEECCQGKSAVRNTCEMGKCCTMMGQTCFDNSECCPSAPNCVSNGSVGKTCSM